MPTRPAQHTPKWWKPLPNKDKSKVDPFYHTLEWKCTRTFVLRRDNYTCVSPECTTPWRGRNSARLAVDHIIERRDGGSDRPSNLRTLCAACHNKRHKKRN